MFEKEAKEYAIENYETCLYDDLPYTNDSKAIEQAFENGAEFGYNKAFVEADKNLKAILTDFNKANEWHKVADGDFPDNCRYVWTNVGAGYHDDDGWWDDCGRLQSVIAWCEPKFEE